MVDRLSKEALRKIISGQVKEEASCFIKFYGNQCKYCIHLKEPFEKFAEETEDAYFFAFNIADYPHVQKILNFKGVPTIVAVKAGGIKPKIRVLSDPPTDRRNKVTWYNIEDIQKFIEKEK
tara:strand:+ start:645 stop:1007 length:363 start_codon:yes stop_codon:yes gene_type:complete